MTSEVKSQRTSNSVIWLVGMAVLVVIGAISWIVQLTKGTTVLGISQIIPWGLYIAVFFATIGLASGLLVLAVLSDLKVIPDLQASRRNLLIGALASYIAGGIMILMDIGKPERVLNIIFKAQFTSPFVWDFSSLALGVIITVILLLVAPKMKWLSVLAGVVAGMIVVFEGWILSISVGSPLWSGGMMPVVFIIDGLLMALAVTLIAKPASDALRRWILVLLPVLFLLNFFELGTMSYAGTSKEMGGTSIILSNPLFWLMVVFGIILPFVLLMWTGKNRSVVMVSAALVILGVFVAKSVTLVAGQSTAFLRGTATYTPTIVEFGGVIGVIGLVGLLYLLGTRFIPQKE